MSLRDDLERKFDPTDSDGAMTLAYQSLKLVALCERALRSNNAGLRIGRDDADQMAVAMLDVGDSLGLVDKHGSAADMTKFFAKLAKEF